MERQGGGVNRSSGHNSVPCSAVLHAPRLNTDVRLIELLDAAVWLFQQQRSADTREQVVHIVLHPVGSPWVRWVRAWIAAQTVTAVLRKLWRIASAAIDGQRTDTARMSLLAQIRAGRSGARVRVGPQQSIHIQQACVEYWAVLRSTLTACVRAAQIWTRFFRGGSLDAQAVLATRYAGVHIGDVIASECIRVSPLAGGSLSHCGSWAVFWCLVDAVYTVDYVKERMRRPEGRSYVTVAEPTYLEAIYLRVLQQHGFSNLELFDYCGQIYAAGPTELWKGALVARPSVGRKLSSAQREQVKRYLDERLSVKGRHLWYMDAGQTGHEPAGLVDHEGRELTRDEAALTVVLFLHSFDDAQYQFGLDGFADLYAWTVASIDACLRNSNIGRVLIKEHPNVDPDVCASDRIAVGRLKARYRHEARVRFINRYAAVNAVASLGRVCGITCHGSVAEELVAAGVPVIGSAHAPWGKHYPFLATWDSPKEYADIVGQLTVEAWRPPNLDEMNALEQFIEEYRLKGLREQALPVIWQWVVWESGLADASRRELDAYANRRVTELHPDSTGLTAWLQSRAHRYAQPAAAVCVNQ